MTINTSGLSLPSSRISSRDTRLSSGRSIQSLPRWLKCQWSNLSKTQSQLSRSNNTCMISGRLPYRSISNCLKGSWQPTRILIRRIRERRRRINWKEHKVHNLSSCLMWTSSLPLQIRLIKTAVDFLNSSSLKLEFPIQASLNCQIKCNLALFNKTLRSTWHKPRRNGTRRRRTRKASSPKKR